MEQTQKRAGVAGSAMQIHIAPWQAIVAFIFGLFVEIIPNIDAIVRKGGELSGFMGEILTGILTGGLTSVIDVISDALFSSGSSSGSGGGVSNLQLFLWFCGSCTAAQMVNFYCYTIIGRFSAVTYQVIAHLKTVLVLTYGLTISSVWDPVHLGGLFITFLGVIWYSGAKGRENKAGVENKKKK